MTGDLAVSSLAAKWNDAADFDPAARSPVTGADGPGAVASDGRPNRLADGWEFRSVGRARFS